MIINVNVEVPDGEDTCGFCRFIDGDRDYCLLFDDWLYGNRVHILCKCDKCLNATRLEDES